MDIDMVMAKDMVMVQVNSHNTNNKRRMNNVIHPFLLHLWILTIF